MFPLRILSRQSTRVVTTQSFIRQLSSCSIKASSNNRPFFLGCRADYTNNLDFIDPSKIPAIPIYRILDLSGKVVGNSEPKFYKDLLVKMYKHMVKMHVMDKVFYDAKHAGQIEFHIGSVGEEALMTASAAALSDADPVWSQYREGGVIMWRGFTIQQCVSQLKCTVEDNCKGHNMALFYGSRKLNFQTISAPLTTQLPEAVGDAYRIKLENLTAKSESSRRIVACYFGEGAASEGDFHAAMNFAATLECPILFLCRNNGYAISTEVKEQYRGDGIACRAPAYGMTAARVDGNDALAVYSAVSQARKTILTDNRPVFLELMSYRINAHSASDDSFMYRSRDEVEYFEKNNNPITRFRSYLLDRKLWSSEQDTALFADVRKEVVETIERCDKMKKPNVMEMFADVYYDGPDGSARPKALQEQAAKFSRHLERNARHYPLHRYAEK